MATQTSGLNFASIIYATDFSAHSESAGRYATLLAKQLSANLIVVHAFILTQAAMEAEMLSQTESKLRRQLRGQLDEAIGRLAGESLIITPVLLDGNPDRTIANFADSHPGSMLVLGTHGGGRFEHALIGSVAEHILRMTAAPTLTVGPRVPPPNSSTLRPCRILCATDLTPVATRGVSIALMLAGLSKGEIDILHVIPESTVRRSDDLQDTVNRLYKPIEDLVPHQVRSLCGSRAFVETGRVHDQVLEHLRERSIDLLVLGVHKSSPASLDMRTSGVFRIIADAPCPVLTVAA